MGLCLHVLCFGLFGDFSEAFYHGFCCFAFNCLSSSQSFEVFTFLRAFINTQML